MYYLQADKNNETTDMHMFKGVNTSKGIVRNCQLFLQASS